MLMIDAHNQEAALGMHSYELAMNHLGDMVSLRCHVLCDSTLHHHNISVRSIQQILNEARAECVFLFENMCSICTRASCIY